MNSFLYLEVKIDVSKGSLQNQYVGTASHLLFNYCTPITHSWEKARTWHHRLLVCRFGPHSWSMLIDEFTVMFGIFNDIFPMELPLVYTYSLWIIFYLIWLFVYLSSSLFHPGVNTSSLPQLSGNMVDEQIFCTCWPVDMVMANIPINGCELL